MAERAIELGYFISISGIVTFAKAENVRAVAEKVPLDRLLIETDAPWLAPVPHRGGENEPAFVADTASFLPSSGALMLMIWRSHALISVVCSLLKVAREKFKIVVNRCVETWVSCIECFAPG